MLGISRSSARNLIPSWVEAKWPPHFQILQGVHNSKSFLPCFLKRQRTIALLELYRSYLRALVGLFTSYGQLLIRHHMNTIGLPLDEECRMCWKEDNTVTRSLRTYFAATRISVFWMLTPYLENFPFDIINHLVLLLLIEKLSVNGQNQHL